MEILDRLKLYISDTDLTDDTLNDIIQRITDRLCLRIGQHTLPPIFNSIVVEASIKVIRRMYYEGIQSESITSISTSFFEDILKEYDDEIRKFIKKRDDEEGKGSGKVVRFL